mgnify:CR=1 FL=1
MGNNTLRYFGATLRARWISPRRIRFWLVLLVVVYTLLGFLGVPWLVQYLAVNTAREDFDRDLRIEAVHLNPYTLTFQIDGLALDDTDDRPLLAWEQLFVDLSWSSIINRAWTFQTIRLDRPVIQEERFTSGETRLSRLIPESKDTTSEEEEAGSPPALRVENLRVEDAILRFADNLPGGTSGDEETNRVAFALQDLELSVDGFTLREEASFPVQLGGQVAGGGVLGFDGTLQLLPSLVLQGETRVDELALKQAEPYLRQFAGVRVDSGALNLSGKIHTATGEPFAFRGAAGIDALSILDGADGELLVGWDSIRTERIKLSLGERQIKTAPVFVDGLSGRVTIHQDRTSNFGRLMAKEAPPAAEEDDEAAGSDAGADPFGITLEAIRFVDGALRFADNSLPLPFSTSIHSLEGQISTLSSTSAQPAQVNLEGQVADYGLARIGGTLHAWHPMRKTSLEVSFRNLEIPEYSPYTVQFAGRKIAGGTMDLDLDYRISDRQLTGDNNLVLHDLRLGEKIASSDAIDLPLDLAIAMLKDRNGVIDLDLPVSGDVGEPEFDIGHVIRQALTKTLASIVQSPFRFLASLVGAESEELGRIAFPEGRSDLTPPQRERVARLRAALNQRPKLMLELSGPFNETLDGPELKRSKAVQALKQHLAEADRDVTDPSLTAMSTQGVVETMFTTRYPDKKLEQVKARFTEPRDESSGETAFDALAYRNHLAERIIAAQPVTGANLKALANERATAVREVLIDRDLDNSIAADRVRILGPTEVVSGEDERITMEIGLAPN